VSAIFEHLSTRILPVFFLYCDIAISINCFVTAHKNVSCNTSGVFRNLKLGRVLRIEIMVIWKVPPCLLVDITTLSEVSYASFKGANADFFEAPFCVADTMTSRPRICSCVASQCLL
jgi:hypothetical protein